MLRCACPILLCVLKSVIMPPTFRLPARITHVLSPVWEALVKPFPSVTGEDVRRKARTIASLCALGIFFVLLTVPLAPLTARLSGAPVLHYATAGSLIGLSLLITLLLARFGYVQVCLLIGVLGITAAILFSASRYGSGVGLRYLYYIGMLNLFSLLFLRGRVLVTLIVVQFLAMVCAPLYIDHATFYDVTIGPVNFFIIVTTFNLLVVRHRDYLEERRTLQIRRSEARYRHLLENISDIVNITTPEGRILSLNRAGRAFYGGGSAEPMAELADEGEHDRMRGISGFAYVHPDDTATAMQMMHELQTDGASGLHQMRMRTHSGEYRWLELRAVLNNTPGEPPTVTTVGRDIHERRQHEDLRRMREERFRFITEMLADYTYCLTIDQKTGMMEHDMIAGSKTPIIGWADDELPDISQGYPPEYRDKAYDVWFQVLAGKPMHIESPVLRKDGSQVWMALYYFPVQTGDTLHVYVVARNIQERVERERERLAKALERERSAMATSMVRAISHDFRTWLATIETSRYLIDRISDSKGVLPHVKDKLDTIRKAVNHLTQQIDNLHMVAVLTQPVSDQCSIVAVLRALRDDYQTLAEEKGQRFALVVPPEVAERDAFVLGSAAELTRAFRQLLTNAFTHTPRDGQIHIGVEIEAQFVVVRVSDTGAGIGPTHLPYIFDMFYRPDSARSTEQGGIGIGLSITKMIIEAYGGRIAVQSMVGQGTIFTITLPRSRPAEAAGRPHAQPSAAPALEQVP
jgi:PAS domain S-box-containing protein